MRAESWCLADDCIRPAAAPGSGVRFGDIAIIPVGRCALTLTMRFVQELSLGQNAAGSPIHSTGGMCRPAQIGALRPESVVEEPRCWSGGR
jgi:hypothetical protein